jgi:hypothetical protein
MQILSDYSEKFDAMVNQYLEPAVTQTYVLPVLALILILYVAQVRPTLPHFVQELFHNNIFRLVVCTYIVYRANHDPQTAVLIAAAFLIIMHMVNKQFIDKFAADVATVPTSVSGCKELNRKYGVPSNSSSATLCNSIEQLISDQYVDSKKRNIYGSHGKTKVDGIETPCVQNGNDVGPKFQSYRTALSSDANPYCNAITPIKEQRNCFKGIQNEPLKYPVTCPLVKI